MEGEGRCLSEVLLEFRTIVSSNSSGKASDDRDDRARERRREGGETTKRVEMLIAIANTAVKSRKEASVSPTHNIVTEEKATRWGAEKTRHNVESG